MIKNILINEKMYQLSTKGGMKGTGTGTCYHLKDENIDWAVKIYRKERRKTILNHPPLEDLERLCAISKEVIPVLVSEYPVFDTEQNYIGCCAPYIYETEGNTLEAIYKQPIDFIMDNLVKLQETLPIFNKHHINLCDWSMENIKLGKAKDLGLGIYVFDDSYYRYDGTIDHQTIERSNQQKFEMLVGRIVSEYFTSFVPMEEETRKERVRYILKFYPEMNEKIENSPLDLLECETRNFNTLEEYFESVKEKKYQL